MTTKLIVYCNLVLFCQELYLVNRLVHRTYNTHKEEQENFTQELQSDNNVTVNARPVEYARIVEDEQRDDRLLSLLIESEGFSPTPYLCPANVWTIGYGFTDKKYIDMKFMSEDQALHILRTEIIPKYRSVVKRYVQVPLTRYQEDALISFTFNLGPGCLQKLCDTKLNRLNSGNYDIIPQVMKLYCKARVNGTITTLKGLQARREKEALLFQGKL